ncbi:MAG TPA: hypothetical protein VK983_05565 [Candidatus Limnocylindrales bacterium]|nr:hypothetical protein [Candidatus Limnocylindrales bacterium]
MIEGTAILPGFVAELACDHEAIFIGNQSSQHYDKVLQFARNDSNNWMHNLEDATIKAFTEFSKVYSHYNEQEALTDGMHYVEVSDNDFDDDIDKALRLLLNHKV